MKEQMRKARTQVEHQPTSGSNGKRTSIGRRNLATSTMNKHKRRRMGKKKLMRGQGR